MGGGLCDGGVGGLGGLVRVGGGFQALQGDPGAGVAPWVGRQCDLDGVDCQAGVSS